MGGEGSFEETSVEDGALDPSYSLSMQAPYLTPGSDGSSSHPPPPYTLQVSQHSSSALHAAGWGIVSSKRRFRNDSFYPIHTRHLYGTVHTVYGSERLLSISIL